MRNQTLLMVFAAALLTLAAPGCNGTESGRVGPDGKLDDWAYFPVDEEEDTASGSSALGAPSAVAAPAPQASMKLGLAAGGAKDVGNFRENLKNRFLPLPTDLTYEGLFYDYFFDTGEVGTTEKLFAPSYSAAVSRDPISRKTDHYLSVGLNSGLDESDFARKKLNLVVVLDISGSMGSAFDKYYYDRFGTRREAEQDDGDGDKKKMRVATEAIVAMLDHLRPEDRLGIVLFDNEAYLAKPMNQVGQTSMESIRQHLLELEDRGGTNMSAGMTAGIELMRPYAGADRAEFENRIIFLTDAMPNRGETSEEGLLGMARKSAAEGVYTTFIGIGLDFNTELIEAISKMRGANYYSVHSGKQFKKRLAEEFDFMVTPLVFDLRLTLEAEGYEILKVYGSPEADEATGEIMRVNTLFPSKVEDGETRGGVILLKLRKKGEGGRLRLAVEYTDRQGRKDRDEAVVEMPAGEEERYANSGVRKAVLLSRYADLLINWMMEERLRQMGRPVNDPFVGRDSGIRVPDRGLTEWERTSMPLAADVHYQEIFGVFLDHLRSEMTALGDEKLEQEAAILEMLKTYGR